MITKSKLEIKREHFETSRELDFLSRKELIAQTGHQVAEWPLVVLKELLDNSLDACEEAGIAPCIEIEVDETSITITDNGPGIPAEVIDKVLDFKIRVSSREAYVSPTRGAQGNALKTVVAMPFSISGRGTVVVESQGVRHEIEVSIDRIAQKPKVRHSKSDSNQAGTKIVVEFPNEKPRFISNEDSRFLQNDEIDGEYDGEKASSILLHSKPRFLQFARGYTWLNPHLALTVRWGDSEFSVVASNPDWTKWLPSNPTDPHWYGMDEFERLIAANICHKEKTVREFVSEFKGLSGSRKQKLVVDSIGQQRVNLSDLITDGEFDQQLVTKLLDAMKRETKPVKPSALGVIGKDHFLARAIEAGGEPDKFRYKKNQSGADADLPFIIEAAFCFCRHSTNDRRIVTGVNWSPGINNPFRQLGRSGQSLDSVLSEQRVTHDEPIVLILHIVCPKVRYADRGKSSIIIER